MCQCPPKSGEAVGVLNRVLYGTVPYLPYVGFFYMLCSAVKAIVDTKGEPGTVFFVATSFSLLGGLLACTRELEKTGGAPSRKLKSVVWLLSTALTLLFSHRVATILSSAALSVFVWAVALLTIASGYLLLFV